MKIVFYKQMLLVDDSFEYFVQSDIRMKIDLTQNLVEFIHPISGKFQYALTSISVGRVGDFLMIHHAGLNESVVFHRPTYIIDTLYQRLSTLTAVGLLGMTEFPFAQLMAAASESLDES